MKYRKPKYLLVLLIYLLFFQNDSIGQVTQINSVVIDNLSAIGDTARRYEVAKIGFNSYHWQDGGIVQIELIQKYFGVGYAKYFVEIGYSQGTGNTEPKVRLVESAGAYQLARVSVGPQSDMGTNYSSYPNKVIPIYVDVRYYSTYVAKITFIRNRVSTLTGFNQIVINEMPTRTIIPNFDAISSNTFIGQNTGFNNITGASNTFLGTSAGYNNTSGTGNTFLGLNSGYLNTTSSWNTFVGNESGRFNTTGSLNTYIGSGAGYKNIGGNGNTFIGINSGYENISSWNTFVGNESGRFNTTGTTNAFFASGAGYKNTEGTGNTFLGTAAGFENTTASWNTYVGYESGRMNVNGTSNVFLGAGAGRENTTGSFNTAIGTNTGRNNQTGLGNTQLGSGAGRSNTSSWNTMIGSNSGEFTTTGGDNTFVGHAAGNLNTIGAANTFLGVRSGDNTTTGNGNTFIGNRAGTTNTTGGNNVFLGGYAGKDNTTGTSNVFIGYEARPSTGNLTNAIAIGYNAVVSANNSMVLGNNTIKVGIGTSTPQSRLDVVGAPHFFTLSPAVNTYYSNLNLGLMTNTYYNLFEFQTKDDTGWGHFNFLGSRYGATYNFSRHSSTGQKLGFKLNTAEGNPNILQIFNESGTDVINQLSSNGNSFINGGNVGIGATNPNARLEISGSSPGSTNFRATGNNAKLVVDYNSLGQNYYDAALHIFRDFVGNERMRISGNGQIAIGNPATVPTDYKLAVAGNVIAEKVKVKKQSSGWPDFVFSPSYKLPNLTEVENFVKQNQHLPEIPSASEIEKEGQDLGEMNRLLLKKVEELTLYLIEQQKEIKVLKSKVEKLEKK